MTSNLTIDFERFAAEPMNAIDGALLISRVVHPATDPAWCRAELRRLADTIGAAAAPATVVAALRTAGFSGATDYYARSNSALEIVLRERRGIPISMAMVVVGVGECLNLPAVGINFPGHFLVEVDSQLIDPYSLSLIDDADRRARLDACGVPAAEALKPATPVDITLRMLNNLRGLAIAVRDFAHAIELTDYQLILAPRAYAVHLARVELWVAMGAMGMAQRELETAIPLAPNAKARSELQAALNKLAGQRPTLH